MDFIFSLIFFTISSAYSEGKTLRYTRAILISGLIRTALTETNVPGMDFVWSRNISLSSFCNRRDILFCLVVSIKLFTVLRFTTFYFLPYNRYSVTQKYISKMPNSFKNNILLHIRKLKLQHGFKDMLRRICFSSSVNLILALYFFIR